MGFDEKGKPLISTSTAQERVIRANELQQEADKRESLHKKETADQRSNAKEENGSAPPSRRVSFADDSQTSGEEAKRLLRQQSETILEEGDDDVMMTQEETEAEMNGLKLKEKKPLYFKLKGTLIWKILMVMKLPELWFISIGLMGCAMTMSFYYVSLVSEISLFL